MDICFFCHVTVVTIHKLGRYVPNCFLVLLEDFINRMLQFVFFGGMMLLKGVGVGMLRGRGKHIATKPHSQQAT